MTTSLVPDGAPRFREPAQRIAGDRLMRCAIGGVVGEAGVVQADFRSELRAEAAQGQQAPQLRFPSGPVHAADRDATEAFKRGSGLERSAYVGRGRHSAHSEQDGTDDVSRVDIAREPQILRPFRQCVAADEARDVARHERHQDDGIGLFRHHVPACVFGGGGGEGVVDRLGDEKPEHKGDRGHRRYEKSGDDLQRLQMSSLQASLCPVRPANQTIRHPVNHENPRSAGGAAGRDESACRIPLSPLRISP